MWITVSHLEKSYLRVAVLVNCVWYDCGGARKATLWNMGRTVILIARNKAAGYTVLRRKDIPCSDPVTQTGTQVTAYIIAESIHTDGRLQHTLDTALVRHLCLYPICLVHASVSIWTCTSNCTDYVYTRNAAQQITHIMHLIAYKDTTHQQQSSHFTLH